MANKHFSEDEIKYVISADSSRAQQELHKLGKSTAALRREEKARRSAMIELEATGKKNSEQYQKLKQECKEYTRQIADNEAKMKELRSTLDVNAMTMNQLRKYAKELGSELNNTSMSASPKQYAELESRLRGVNMRIEELRSGAVRLRQHFLSMESFNVMAGNIMTKLGELAGRSLRKLTGFVSDAIDKSIELAESADGITHAFDKIGTKEYLQTLREATKGTVSDIELMKAAVKAKDFRIPLENLGKYLSFAQLKAQQTGQSLDYMVDSIVTGLGRKSPMILDNLGLSAAEISEKTKETGDFMKAVASIVEGQLAAAGETYISAADRAARRTVELENAQKDLGDVLLPLKEEFAEVYGQIQIGTINAIKYLVQHRDTLLFLGKAVALLATTYLSYVAGLKLAHLWSLRAVAVSKLKAAAAALENSMLELSVLRHAVLNKTMTRSIALQKAFNIVLKMSPWGLVFGGITLVAGALLMFGKRTDAATIAQKRLNSVRAEANRKVEEERIKIEMLTRRIHDNSLSLAERRDAISALQKIVPDYTAKLSQEGKVYDENTSALTRYLNALKEKALLEGAQAEIKDLGKQKAALIIQQRQQEQQLGQLKEEQAKFMQQNAGRPQTTGGAVVPEIANTSMNYSANASALSKEIKKTADKIKALDFSLDAIDDEFGKKMFKPESGDGGKANNIGTVGGELDAIAKKIDTLKSKRLTIKVGDTKALKAIDGQIAALEKRKAALEYKSGPGKPGKSKKDKKTDDASTSLSHDRSQDLDEARQSYADDLNMVKKALAEKRITQEQYNAYAAALNIQHQNNLLAIEESYQERSRGLVMKDAAKKRALQEGQDKAVADQRQAACNAYIEGERLYYDALDKMQQMRLATVPQTLRQECDAKLLVLEGYYKASLQSAGEDAERQKQLTASYEAAKAAIKAEYAKKEEEEKARARQEYGLDTYEDQIAAQAKKRKADYDKGLIDKEQYDRAMANLEKQAEEHRLQVRRQYGLASQQEIYNAELEQLRQHLQNKELSEEEYEEAVKNLKISKMKETFDYYANLSGGAVQALQQAEEANVDAKYDAEIEAARNAGKDTTELERKKANEKLRIQKKYADVNFAIKASQIIADTATAIMKAHADLGPVAGAVAAALMGVTGAAQLAAANAERQKVKKMTLNGAASSASSGTRVATGLESGGSIDVEREQDGRRFHAAYDPMRRGFVDRPTVIVGEGPAGQSREWVASNAAVENPTVAPIIDIIDHAQRAGTIRTLDMGKFLVQQTQGRASGGSLAPAAADVRPVAQESYKDTLIERLTAVLDRLATDGIPASVALDEIDRKQQLRDRSRKFGSKD